jgi:hypothetical protein
VSDESHEDEIEQETHVSPIAADEHADEDAGDVEAHMLRSNIRMDSPRDI